MTENKIVIGTVSAPAYTITDEDIRDINMVKGVDIVGAELSIDQIKAKISGNPTDNMLLAPADYDEVITSDGYTLALPAGYSDLPKLPYGTEIRYYRNNALDSLYYSQNVDRVGVALYDLNGMSAIGLLDTQNHRGNVYSGSSFFDVLTEIIDGIVPFTVDDAVADIKIFGWLPYATKRSNLHKLLFATGVMVSRNSDGNMHFRFLENNAAKQIPQERFYESGSIDYSSPATAVQVTEHAYFITSDDEEVTVYDNTDGSETANNTFVTFGDNAPLHDLSVTGELKIIDSGVNWAVVTGTGALAGKKYTHSTKLLTLNADNAENYPENVVTVTDDTLVSTANSANVAKRVLSYYSSKKTVNTAIVVEDEQAGAMITGTDPYYETISGFISSMDINVSTILKANCEIITDYIPTDSGNNYTDYFEIVTDTAYWEIPSAVLEKDSPTIQFILIGGGYGGYGGDGGSGGSGNEGMVSSSARPGDGGSGGAGGKPGAGGRVYVVTVDCLALFGDEADPACWVSFTVGAGGAGGIGGAGGGDRHIGDDENGEHGLAGSDGGATIITIYNQDKSKSVQYTSASGATLENGVSNLFTGTVYALGGESSGIAGGDGAGYNNSYIGGTVIYNGATYTYGSQGKTVTGYRTGYCYGGYGGGPAAGANGQNGYDGWTWHNQGSGWNQGGTGGNGADGAVGAAAYGNTGQGGSGGHGGGGGGAGGGATGDGGFTSSGYGGDGGKGGDGGTGASGLVVGYY